MTAKSGHNATWLYAPDCDSRAVGQYYCAKCRLTLELGYNRHYESSVTGWHWTIKDGSGEIVDAAGNKLAPKYEPDVGALAEIKEEAVRRFDSIPCARAN
jgi:hypothetical protein